MSSAKNKRWWRAISVRIGAWYFLVLALVLVLGAVGARWSMVRAIGEEQQVLVRAEITRQQERLSGATRQELAGKIGAEVSALTSLSFVRIVDNDNRTLAFGGGVKESDFQPNDLRPGTRHRLLTRKTQVSALKPGHPWSMTQERIDSTMWLQVGIDDRPRLALVRRVEEGVATLLAVAAVLGLIGGVWLTRRALAPIRVLTNTSRELVASGELSARMPIAGAGDELDELSEVFNQVLSKNQRLVLGMRAALDNVAHDLRTPLTRLRSGAELALHQDGDAPAQREALADCVEETDRVLVMLQTLMDISEAETGVMRLEHRDVDLRGLCSDAVDMYEHVAEEQGIGLALQEGEPVVAHVDPTRIMQAVTNLVDNAIKYSDTGGQVKIAVWRDNDVGVIEVVDDGGGIEEADLPRIWERLYRADASRTRQGLGLGLSFVKAVVEAHHGTVAVDSQVDRGSTFTLRLPLRFAAGDGTRAQVPRETAV